MKLVVVDSIAALFRAEFGPHQLARRSELLRAFGAQLLRLSDLYSVAVVCVNQVTVHIYWHSISLLFSVRNPMHVVMVCLYSDNQ